MVCSSRSSYFIKSAFKPVYQKPVAESIKRLKILNMLKGSYG